MSKKLSAQERKDKKELNEFIKHYSISRSIDVSIRYSTKHEPLNIIIGPDGFKKFADFLCTQYADEKQRDGYIPSSYEQIKSYVDKILEVDKVLKKYKDARNSG